MQTVVSTTTTTTKRKEEEDEEVKLTIIVIENVAFSNLSEYNQNIHHVFDFYFMIDACEG